MPWAGDSGAVAPAPHAEQLDAQWRTQYRDQRYMEHIPLQELNQRAAYLVTNLTELTPEGTLGVIPADGEGQEWWRRWAHVLEEFQLRGMPRSADVLAGVEQPKLIVPPEYLALSETDQPLLLKFGKRAHMEALFEQGSMRIAPASRRRAVFREHRATGR